MSEPQWRARVQSSVSLLQEVARRNKTEPEVHLGTGTRVDEGPFAGKVDATMFFASFSRLAPSAAHVGGHERASWETYPRPVPRSVWHWTHPRDNWSDVRSCPVAGGQATPAPAEWPWRVCVLPMERREACVAVPNAVLEARAIAKRVARPMQNQRTRIAYPQFMFQRERRTLRFASFPLWFVHFDVVSVTGGVVCSENEYVYHAGPTVHLITLVPAGGRVPEGQEASAAEEACGVIEKIALSVGRTKREVRDLVEGARREREMEMCEV